MTSAAWREGHISSFNDYDFSIIVIFCFAFVQVIDFSITGMDVISNRTTRIKGCMGEHPSGTVQFRICVHKGTDQDGTITAKLMVEPISLSFRCFSYHINLLPL